MKPTSHDVYEDGESRGTTQTAGKLGQSLCGANSASGGISPLVTQNWSHQPVPVNGSGFPGNGSSLPASFPLMGGNSHHSVLYNPGNSLDDKGRGKQDFWTGAPFTGQPNSHSIPYELVSRPMGGNFMSSGYSTFQHQCESGLDEGKTYNNFSTEPQVDLFTPTTTTTTTVTTAANTTTTAAGTVGASRVDTSVPTTLPPSYGLPPLQPQQPLQPHSLVPTTVYNDPGFLIPQFTTAVMPNAIENNVFFPPFATTIMPLPTPQPQEDSDDNSEAEEEHPYRSPKQRTKKRKFACNICGKQLSQRGGLHIHMRIHSQEKPYECKVCGTSFTQACNQKRHERSHTGEKPFSCSICGKSFNRKQSMTNHVKKQHPASK